MHVLSSDRTAQVCKDWARLCRAQMTPVAPDLRWAPKITAADVLCVARRFRLVGSLRLAGNAITAAGLEKILETCPVLSELDLTEFTSRLAQSTIRMVATCCVTLSALRLGSCWQFDSLPAEIGQLTGLHTLDLSYCEQLVSLPAEIGQLTGLHTLRGCSDRLLASLPRDVAAALAAAV